ncbi:MAG: GrdX family protein [Syntrophaceticus sp.]
MRKKIVTNNPLVQNKYTDNVLYIDGNVEQTLIKVRDMVYEGYELISHPLPASLRMLFSPYRSIVIGKKQKKVDFMQAEIAEESIHKYNTHMNSRQKDEVNSEGYQMVDLILLESALNDEQGRW